jgi:TonB family protein
LKITPLQNKRLPKREEPEDNLHFPLLAYQPKERQLTSSEDLAEKRFGFEKRQIEEVKREFPSLPSIPGIESPPAQKRQFGIPKKNETDQNRFGIFAGRTFEEPQIKESVQEAVIEKEEQEAAVSDETETAKALQAESQIEGPVKGRAIVRRPRPPQVNIDIEVELKFKFWVLPDGTIGEVIPIKRGNAELEQIAIAYLKKWQFEPLPTGVSQQKIWGTIPIRFTVQ